MNLTHVDLFHPNMLNRKNGRDPLQYSSCNTRSDDEVTSFATVSSSNDVVLISYISYTFTSKLHKVSGDSPQ